MNAGQLTFSDIIQFSTHLRSIGKDASSMEEVAQNIVRYLYEKQVDRETGENLCALVRFYKTHPLGELDTKLSAFAQKLLSNIPASPAMKCMTLLATVGQEKQWNSRLDSRGHQAIPLPSEKVVLEIPMISQLIKQFGVKISNLLKPDPSILVDLDQRNYNVFHVEKALGSPYIPAQKDFVIPYNIKSALGFGGMLPSGDLFAVIQFTKVTITKEEANMFKTLAVSVKVAILPFMNGPLFS